MNALEAFTRGERRAVDPVALERELTALWREAGSEGAVTRACLWNVVVVADARSEAPPRWIDALVQGLPEKLATRTLVLRLEPSDDNGPELASWISANCRAGSGGGKLVCSEELTLAARGAGVERLPPLVRALLMPGLPTAVVLRGAPDAGDRWALELMELADEVVTWSPRPRPPPGLGPGRAARAWSDLGWVDSAALRSAIAALFDGAPDAVERLERIEAAGPGGDLLLGWIAHRLAPWERAGGALTEGGVRVRRGDRPLAFHLASGGGSPRLEFHGAGAKRGVRREAAGGLCLERPSGRRRWDLDEEAPAALLARALLGPRTDAELEGAIAALERLEGTT